MNLRSDNYVLFKKALVKSFIAAALFSAQFSTYAAGMVPETSLLVIDEATHSGTINVKNTDSFPALLYTNVLDLPDDQGLKLIATQPVVRLELARPSSFVLFYKIKSRWTLNTINV